jgi:hypothetical protein
MIDDAWYDEMLIVRDDAPEILGEYCEQKAKELGVSLEYFMDEFI